MLPVAFAAALFLGAAHPAVADGPHFPLRNSTTNATETQAAPVVVWTTVTQIVTQTADAGCPANYALNRKPTATESPTATFVNSAPAATLSPNVHWSYDTKAIENVIPVEPKKGCELYYGVSGKTSHLAHAKGTGLTRLTLHRTVQVGLLCLCHLLLQVSRRQY